MEAELLACGYSFHSKPFAMGFIEKLPSFLFRLQTDGHCKALVKGKMRTVEPGDLLLFQQGDPYELRVDTAEPDGSSVSGDYFLFCQGQWIRDWWNRSEKPTCTRIDLDERILSLWRQLHLEKHKVAAVEPELLTYLLCALCISLERAVIGTASLQGRSNLTVKFTSDRMKRYIEDHAKEDFKVQDVADHVGLSVSRAVHLFKESFDFTMVQYALEIKLSNAVERMNYTHMSLEQIAESCGFGSYAYFHKVFKRKYGVSPTQFRMKATFGRQRNGLQLHQPSE
ncbi:helix-turn-helix domain-containing protein [Alicyclobacillus fodiniaquatilis]|uniref:Helix-turn-helix domain-containing protein n=1 Tax=Alicyclobacillus fodiniaquatilis TaxID=1661150 RepID=A0ABW4JIF1_9BACL